MAFRVTPFSVFREVLMQSRRVLLSLVVAFFLLQVQGARSLAAESVYLVLQKAESSMGFYSPAGMHLASVPVGKHPHEFVISSDGRYAYTTDNGTMLLEQAGQGGNTVSIVDLVNRKRVGEISLGEFRRPHGIDLDRKTGHLAISCELPDRLLIIDPASRKMVRHYDTQGKTSHMVTLGLGAQWAFVSNSTSNNVAAIHLETGKAKLIPTSRRPEGSVLSKDGSTLYVATREGISIIETGKQVEVGRIVSGKGPNRIGLTPDERYLVYSLIEENKVEVADPKTHKVLGQIPLEGRPVSLSVSRDGKYAFASAQDDDTVYVVSIAERRIARIFKTAKGAGPDPMQEVLIRMP
jgi:DNA-binding beta-propeller fold protein YncE